MAWRKWKIKKVEVVYLVRWGSLRVLRNEAYLESNDDEYGLTTQRAGSPNNIRRKKLYKQLTLMNSPLAQVVAVAELLCLGNQRYVLWYFFAGHKSE
jgi:hypothetical protein